MPNPIMEFFGRTRPAAERDSARRRADTEEAARNRASGSAALARTARFAPSERGAYSMEALDKQVTMPGPNKAVPSVYNLSNGSVFTRRRQYEFDEAKPTLPDRRAKPTVQASGSAALARFTPSEGGADSMEALNKQITVNLKKAAMRSASTQNLSNGSVVTGWRQNDEGIFAKPTVSDRSSKPNFLLATTKSYNPTSPFDGCVPQCSASEHSELKSEFIRKVKEVHKTKADFVDLQFDDEDDTIVDRKMEGIDTTPSDDPQSPQSGGPEPDASTDPAPVTEEEDNLVFEPAAMGAKERNRKPHAEGTVAMLDEERGFGFVRAETLPEGYKKANVYFRLDRVVNVGQEKRRLRRGSRVSICLDHKSQEKPRAFMILFDDDASGLEDDVSGLAAYSRRPKLSMGWRSGRVVRVLETRNAFVKDIEDHVNRSKDYFMHSEKISAHAIPLKPGDRVEFVPSDRSGKGPSVLKAKQREFVARSPEEFKVYLESTAKTIKDIGRAVLLEILPLSVQWRFIADSEAVNVNDLVTFILSLVEQASSGINQNILPVLRTLLEGKVIKTCDLVLGTTLHDDIKMVCQAVVKHTPALSLSILPLLKPLRHDVYQNFMYGIMEGMAKAAASKVDGQESLASDWKSLPFVPSTEELKAGLVEANKYLQPVHVSQPYSSPNEYMDIYFRLHRAEAFHAIQDAVSKLLKGAYDPRDFNVYHSIFFAGVEITQSSICFALQFKSHKRVRNWEMSRLLTFGNLVCLSPGQKFGEDVIWATVSNRDTEILNKSSIIFVELCDFNKKPINVIINDLQAHGGHTVMVESPTYFHSVRSILETLSSIDPNHLPLSKEIVSVEYDRGKIRMPSHFKDLVSDGPINENTEELLQMISKIREGLDAAQENAFVHCLTNRLSIVQGPPGCGKTFLGAKILEVLLKVDLGGPILVLTYKNHALDEFLLHATKFCSKEKIVRIGGRSKEPELEKCNLNALDVRSTSAIYDQIQELKDVIEKTSGEVRSALRRVHETSQINEYSVLRSLNSEQLHYLLAKHPDGRKRSHATNKVIPLVLTKWKSLDDYVKEWSEGNVDDKEKECVDMMIAAVRKWMPDKMLLSQVKDFERTLNFERSKDLAEDDADHVQRDSKEEQEDSDGEFDSEDIAKLNADRMAAAKTNSSRGDLLLLELDSGYSQYSFKVSDFPSSVYVSMVVLDTADLWELKPDVKKYQFIFSLMLHEREESMAKFAREVEKLKVSMQLRQQLRNVSRTEALKSKSLIGVTITGASINHELLQQVDPKVVIVEEAAEIMESSLVAALGKSVRHLIMIGDHKQLRPQVDTWELRRDYKLDVSMMERLIRSKYPFKALKKQNRMRPEFSALLKDIYPNLEDNMERVAGNKPIDCIVKSMFFWSHDCPEEGRKKGDQEQGRSKKNEGEADMVVTLVLFMLINGTSPSQITVLAAYQGQTVLIRKKLRAAQQRLFASESAESNFIQVHTIDMFQGDENDYVIVSLVRSNNDGNLGFLGEINRRCVAQSRAKCGLYFVGSADTVTRNRGKKSVWAPIVESMKREDCVGRSLEIQCPRHKGISVHSVESSKGELQLFVENPKRLCNIVCGETMPCDLHKCREEIQC